MSAVMKGARIQQMFRQVVTLVFMVCRLWRKIPGGATARENPAHNPRNGPFRPTPADEIRNSGGPLTQFIISTIYSALIWGVRSSAEGRHLGGVPGGAPSVAWRRWAARFHPLGALLHTFFKEYCPEEFRISSPAELGRQIGCSYARGAELAM